MSYTIYHTEGFVLTSFDSGEANKFFYIYTKDFGLIGATAQGVRHLKSKLRFSLQDLSFVNVSLVRGKGVWRIVNARMHDESIADVVSHKEKRIVFSRIISLIRRLVNGEQADDALYRVLRNGYSYLESPEPSKSDLRNLEIMSVLQILYILGYLAPPQEYLSFIESDVVSLSLLRAMDDVQKDAISVINTTLRSIDM